MKKKEKARKQRHPARLLVYDGRAGTVLTAGEMTGDAEDLYYDAASGKVLISGGAGTVSIFQAVADGEYNQIANIPTRSGARTSRVVPERQLLVVAAREGPGNSAALLVYSLTR
jgi:hypothetical protein